MPASVLFGHSRGVLCNSGQALQLGQQLSGETTIVVGVPHSE